MGHGRIQPLGQGFGAAEMGGDEHHPIRRRQVGPGEIIEIAGRCMGDRRAFRLTLVEQRQRAAARPADQDHPAIAELVAREADILAEIAGDLFHDQGAVVLGVAAGRAQHVQPAIGQRRRHRQQLQRRGRMHEQIDRVRGPAPRQQALSFQRDDALIAREPVGLGHSHRLGELDQDRNPVPCDLGHRAQGQSRPARKPMASAMAIMTAAEIQSGPRAHALGAGAGVTPPSATIAAKRAKKWSACLRAV